MQAFLSAFTVLTGSKLLLLNDKQEIHNSILVTRAHVETNKEVHGGY